MTRHITAGFFLHFNSKQFMLLNVVLCILLCCLPLSLLIAQPLALESDHSDSSPIELTPIEKLRLESQRYHYQAAKQARSKGQLKQFYQHYQALDDYPLKPYLDYTLLRTNMRQTTIEELRAFLELYPNSFLSLRLRQSAMSYFSSRKQWHHFLEFYRPEFTSVKIECLHTYAKAQLGDNSFYEKTANIWNVGKSQPKECDALFSLWKKHGGLTETLKWSRFNKAMQNGRRSLARYVSRSMGVETLKYAQLYHQVDANPRLITRQTLFQEQREEIQDIISYGIKKLARRDPSKAMTYWERYEAQQLFSEKQQRSTKLDIIRQLTRHDKGHEAQRLLSYSRSLHDTKVIEELVRDGLSKLDWSRALASIDLLDEKAQETDRWRYWRARALEQHTDDQNGKRIAEKTYASLAQKRSFYGFLSADHLRINYSLKDASKRLPKFRRQAVADLPGMKRAYELWRLGSTQEARAEWLFTAKNLSSEELVAAGQLAKDWGWYNGGIQAMIKGDLWDHLTVRFPLAYKDEVNRAAQTTQLDPTLIFAVARQESAFDSQAKSSAGAMGLMQLLPTTARQTAMRQGLQYRTSDLYKVKHNIRLGSHYLSELLTKYKGNRILATAAYNAGPTRVKSWLNDNIGTQTLPFDVWIETIPFRETRGYVQNVLAYTVIYSYRLGEARNMITSEEAKRKL